MARWMVSNLICLHCSARSCLAVSIGAHIGFVVSLLLAVVHCWTELVCAVMHLSVDNSGRRYTWGCWNGREMQTLPGGDRESRRREHWWLPAAETPPSNVESQRRQSCQSRLSVLLFIAREDWLFIAKCSHRANGYFLKGLTTHTSQHNCLFLSLSLSLFDAANSNCALFKSFIICSGSFRSICCTELDNDW